MTLLAYDDYRTTREFETDVLVIGTGAGGASVGAELAEGGVEVTFVEEGSYTPTSSLSGGNIQKVILARELSASPTVLLACQPTRGVDIGAAEYIHTRLIEQRSIGTATILISEDLDEVLGLADRVAVMYEGDIVAIVQGQDASREQIGLLMAGVVEQTTSS